MKVMEVALLGYPKSQGEIVYELNQTLDKSNYYNSLLAYYQMTSEISLNYFIDSSRYSRLTSFDPSLTKWHWDLTPNPLRTGTFKDGDSVVTRIKALLFEQGGDFILT